MPHEVGDAGAKGDGWLGGGAAAHRRPAVADPDRPAPCAVATAQLVGDLALKAHCSLGDEGALHALEDHRKPRAPVEEAMKLGVGGSGLDQRRSGRPRRRAPRARGRRRTEKGVIDAFRSSVSRQSARAGAGSLIGLDHVARLVRCAPARSAGEGSLDRSLNSLGLGSLALLRPLRRSGA